MRKTGMLKKVNMLCVVLGVFQAASRCCYWRCEGERRHHRRCAEIIPRDSYATAEQHYKRQTCQVLTALTMPGLGETLILLLKQ